MLSYKNKNRVFYAPAEHLSSDRQVVFLLEKADNRDVIEALLVIEDSLDRHPPDCKQLCYNLIGQLRNRQNTSLVAEFMSAHLSASLERWEAVYLSKLLLGCRALACLAPALRDDYDHLVSEPALLLEQLLMNMKVRGGVSHERECASWIGGVSHEYGGMGQAVLCT